MFFFQFQGDYSQIKEHFFLPFCDILTALCHSKLYFCLPNFRMYLQVKCIERRKNAPFLVPKMEEKNAGNYGLLAKVSEEALSCVLEQDTLSSA